MPDKFSKIYQNKIIGVGFFKLLRELKRITVLSFVLLF